MREINTAQMTSLVASTLAVGILTYNDPIDVTSAAIESLLAQGIDRSNVIVLSNSRTSDISLLCDALGVTVASSIFNGGYTGGNNILLEVLFADKRDGVVLCNPDITLEPDCVQQLLEVCSVGERVGVVGGVELAGSTGCVRTVGGSGYSLALGRAYWNTRVREHGILNVPFVQGALVLVTRLAFDAGLRFDPRLFMYCDELDFGLKASFLRLEVYVNTRALYKHHNEEKQFGELAGYYIQRNRCLIVAKYAPRVIAVLFVVYVMFVEIPPKCIVRAMQGRWRFTSAIWRGAISGVSAILMENVIGRRR